MKYMALNLEIWSFLIGLMELGCALTWNHDEQFVEGEFPYFPYTNRIYAYADAGDGLTDARMRSNEFSGLKTALKRRNFQEKRKPLYAFNKDSNKLIDATKVNFDQTEIAEKVHEPNSSRQERPTDWPNSTRRRMQPAESEDSEPAKNLNRSKTRYSEIPDRKHSAERNMKPVKSGKFRSARPKISNFAKARRPDGAKRLLPNEDHLEAAESEKSTALPEPHNSAEARYPDGLELSKSAKPETPNSDEAKHSDASEPGNVQSAKQEPKSSNSNEQQPAETENANNPDKAESSSRFESAKQGTKMLARHHKKVTRTHNGKSKVPKRQRRNSGLEASLAWRSHNFGESNPKDLWTHGISSKIMAAEGGQSKFTRENKPNDKSRKLTLVAPYENNFTGGGLRSVSPSSWLAKEIERFIRRKDHRWLDFMKNSGMDVKKKYPSVASEAKRKPDKTNTQKTSCVNCLQPSSAPNHLETQKLKTDLLINRIDSLLADLNQFRSSVKNGWPDNNDIKKTRESETSQKLTNDETMDRRKHRLRRGIKFVRKPSWRRSPDLENDLRDLRKNVFLYQNRLADEDRQELKDMKLHIKVYVEKDKQREREDHRECGSAIDYYELHPQQIQFKQ